MITKNTIKKVLVYSFLYLVTIAIVASLFMLKPYPKDDFPLLRLFIVFFASALLTKYFIYMMIAPWHDVSTKIKKRFLAKHAPPYNPLVSVIVPAWNEEVGLLSTVKTILASTYRNIEIVVVNDGSTDSSDKIMREFTKTYKDPFPDAPHQIELRYFYKQNGGKGRALNYGIDHSHGEIIMSIDADCMLTPTTVQHFVDCFKDHTVYAAVGNVQIGNTNTILGTVQYLEFLFSFYFKKVESLLNTIYIVGGAAGAFRREVFVKLGGYHHTNITEDIELSMRIQKEGMRIVYASDAMVYTEGATTLEGLMKQRLRWKRGRFQTFREHKKLFFSTDRRHNKILTWIMLPFALFGDAQLFFEIWFVLYLYVYSFLTQDFSSFISGIIVVSVMFLVQMFFEESPRKRASLYILAPIGWLMFYVSTIVEYNALIKSILGMVKKQELVWQKWERKGVLEDGLSMVYNDPAARLKQIIKK
jgi:biofilm PGA synthesis N-glycosyltransferase PgaC